ncbi:hypothetical protein EVB97_132 [Rhizobium phage RHph_Y65]|uniref:Uncharacterized protein n=1 Tax=Rhizobium phage RHph_Y65 TaxID=2509785 RepID=A0A7S5UVW2_9CAUD|nr:hypothetical protein PQC17_gp132 [Rhizobium phage RHph_Y65]QIG72690.1 hypothetical protein EVB97_132 [Rhizobium phage RHph_Y65]
MNDLFTSNKFSELKSTGLSLTKKETVVVHKYVSIGGVSFDVEELLDFFDDIDSNVWTVEKTGKILIEYGILKDLGSQRWMTGAGKGPNFDEFQSMLRNIADE